MTSREQVVVVPEARAGKSGSPGTRPAVKPENQGVGQPLRGATSEVALLTGGGDRPYALGLASALISQGIHLDFIGSDELASPALHTPEVRFLNLRGDQRSEVSFVRKMWRVLAYYVNLIRYAWTSEAKLFHILWHNKFQFLDRTLVLVYYKLLGKRIVFTAHNVNAGKRDSKDTFLNRLSLKIQYRLVDHIFVHTRRMKSELSKEFGVAERKVTVIPFGINNTVPNTALTTAEARARLGLERSDRVLLFFGNIAPYKGLEHLVAAFRRIAKPSGPLRLIIAGRPKNCEGYWNQIQDSISSSGVADRIIERIEFIPDDETELYFKAADVLVLPYVHIFQSGVLFLAYNFGLPVIAADVGSLREEIIEEKTGFIFEAADAGELARIIEKYFESELFGNLDRRREEIQSYANGRYSWTTVGEMTQSVYSQLLAE